MGCCGQPSSRGTEDDPIVVGEPDGEPPLQLVATLTIYGIGRGQSAWWSGNAVGQLLSSGFLTA